MYGAIRVHDLAVVREILLKEGFYDASFLHFRNPTAKLINSLLPLSLE
jgi:hypothetical protein